MIITLDEFKASPLSRRDIRNFAADLRRRLQLDPAKQVDILWLLEDIMPLILNDADFHLEIVPCDDMGDVHALTAVDRHTIYVREDIYERAARGYGRDRFTITHELGHYLLHDGIAIGLARKGQSENVPRYCDPEWQADCFSGEFLMPAEHIQHMTVESIARTYGVSTQAATFQLRRVTY